MLTKTQTNPCSHPPDGYKLGTQRIPYPQSELAGSSHRAYQVSKLEEQWRM